MQVTQPQQVYEMTGPQLREKGEIYESYNYYGNKVTEYLQVAGANVYYSTSARPKEIKMIVSKAGFSGYILQFPKGAGDNQRYGMKKNNALNLIITTPNGKKQRYDRKYE